MKFKICLLSFASILVKKVSILKRLILLLVAFAPVLSFAQSQKRTKILPPPVAHHEVGIQVGVANYYGDLQTKYMPDYGYQPAFGVIYKHFFHPRIGVRLNAMYTRITAADSLSGIAAQEKRNLRFGSNIFEVGTGLEFNFLSVDFNRSKFSPYIFAGVAMYYSNPYTDGPNNSRLYLRTMGTEGQGIPQYTDRKPYGVMNASFPIGGGLKFLIGNTVLLTAEVSARYCATDYLDDVSKSYVNLDTLQKYRGKQSADYAFRGDEKLTFDGNYPNYGYQRGDSRKNDWYWTGTLGITVYFDAFGNKKEYKAMRCNGR